MGFESLPRSLRKAPQYYVSIGSTRFPPTGYITYSKSLTSANAPDDFAAEERTQGDACPWGEFYFTSMNDAGTLDQFQWPNNPVQTWWQNAGVFTQFSFKVWGNNCFDQGKCMSPTQ